MLIENADYAFIINKEEDDINDQEFLSFKLIASRVKTPKVTYFAQKFENGMKLEEDINLSKSLSYDAIGDNLKDFNPNAFRSKIEKEQQGNNTNNSNLLSTMNKKITDLTPNSNKINFETDNIKSTDELDMW